MVHLLLPDVLSGFHDVLLSAWTGKYVGDIQCVAGIYMLLGALSPWCAECVLVIIIVLSHLIEVLCKCTHFVL